jgi:hypothetical protein
VDDLAVAVDCRADWAMDGTVALFVPSPGGWSARVTFTRVPGRSYERLHIAIVDPAKVARYTSFASTVAEAVRVAEAHVRAKVAGAPS